MQPAMQDMQESSVLSVDHEDHVEKEMATQYSFPGNLMSRGAWQVPVYEATKSRTGLSGWAHTISRTI